MICKGREINLDEIKKDIIKAKGFIDKVRWFTIINSVNEYGTDDYSYFRLENSEVEGFPIGAKVHMDFVMSKDMENLLRAKYVIGCFKNKNDDVIVDIDEDNKLIIKREEF